MRTTRKAAALAAALGAVCCAAAPSQAASANYDCVKSLVDDQMRWFDVAERLLVKLESAGASGSRAEALLGMAYLQKTRGDTHSKGEPSKRREFYEGKDKGALHYITEFEKLASKDSPLRGEALSLRSGIQQELSRVYEDLIRTLPDGDAQKTELITRRLEMRKKAVEGLKKAMAEAEAAYLQALKAWRDPGAAANAAEAEKKKAKAYVEYVIASQQYILALVKNAEGVEKDSNDQKALGKEIVSEIEGWLKHQGDTTGNRPIYEDPPEGVQMWMNLHLARGYVYAGKVDDAVEKGFKKVRDIDPDKFEGPASKWAWQVLLTSMMYEAMALYDKAEVTKARKDYEDARNAIGYQFNTKAAGTKLGILAMILKGQVLGKLKEHTAAIAELNRALDKIKELGASKSAEAQFALDLNQRALRAMSDVVLEMLQEGKPVDVSPEVLVEAGKSCVRQGNLNAAVNCFRQAVNAFQLLAFQQRAVHPNGEAAAWHYMGIVYTRMDAYLEAQLAFEGALESFLDSKMPKEFVANPKNKEVIAKVKEEVLTKCARDGRIAASRERGLNGSEFNKDRFLKWIDWEIELDPAKRADKPYYLAKSIMDSADGAMKDIRDAGSRAAASARAQALELYTKAKEAFLALPESSTYYEEGLYLAGVCAYQSLSVLGYKGQTPADEQRVAEFGAEALKHFKAYEAWITKNKEPRVRGESPQQREQERQAVLSSRKSHRAAIALYEPFIQFETKNYEAALQAAEKLRDRKDLDPPQTRSLHRILFKCYIELAKREEKDLTKIKGLLEKAEGEVNWFGKIAANAKPEEREALENSHDFYVNSLAMANGDAMRALEREFKGMGLSEDAAQKEYDAFKRRKAELTKRLTAKEKYKTIDGLGIVAKSFIELGDFEEACNAYEEILTKFDADGNRMGKTDDQLVDFDQLRSGDALQNTETISTGNDMAQARKRINEIEARVKGREAKKEGGAVVQPEVAKDYDGAVQLIDTFLKDHPGYDSKKDSKPGSARQGLDALREELLFRLKLLRAANGKTICRVNLGEQLLEQAKKAKTDEDRKKLKDEAQKNFVKGLESAEDAFRYWPKEAEVRYNKAQCLLHTAGEERTKLEKAKEEFDSLRRGLRYGTETFWKATQGAVTTRVQMKDWDGARTILGQLLLGDPDGVREGWPDVAKYVRDVAKEKNIPVEEFLGKKVDIEKFDYRPRSELELQVEKKESVVLPAYLRTGKVTKEVHDLRLSLLKELVKLANDGKLEGTKIDSRLLVEQISAGLVTSLKELGGISRGEELDKSGPKSMKGEEEPEKKEAADDKQGAAPAVPCQWGGAC